eukprot:51892-Prorocentrum_minimum.AAC.1
MCCFLFVVCWLPFGVFRTAIDTQVDGGGGGVGDGGAARRPRDGPRGRQRDPRQRAGRDNGGVGRPGGKPNDPLMTP